jgi:diguanylate cyclase
MAAPFRSLHATLIVPFVLLVVAVACGIYWISYSAALRAVDEISDRLVEDVAARVAQAASQQLAGATAVLNVAVPEGAQRLDETTEMAFLTPNTVSPMEQRLWLASGLFGDNYRNVYYASESGRFLGLYRNTPIGGELRLRARAEEPRRIYRALNAERRGELLREDNFEPHEQLWYRNTLERRAITWSPVFRDAKTDELMVTLARPVLRPEGGVRGVAATDVSLGALSDFVRSLKVGDHAVVYIVDATGQLIVSSKEGEGAAAIKSVVRDASGEATNVRPSLRADASTDALVRESYAAHSKAAPPPAALARGDDAYQSNYASYDMPGLGETHSAMLFFRNGAGLDWRIVVAVPLSDHLGPLHQGMNKGIAAGGAAVLLALVIGFWVLRRVASDVAAVSRAAEKLVTGEGPITRIPQREDEIGSLASSMAAIQGALLYDKLTGALNRDAFTRQFSMTVAQLPLHEKLALIFIDLDRFKRVNDRYGHAVGDSVLAKSAERIRRRLREHDLLARFGGDEFVVMIHGVHAVDSIDTLVERLGERLRMGMTIEEHNVAVGASIGIAVYPDDGEALDELIRIADERMYGEKRRSAVVRQLRKSAKLPVAP